MLEFPFKCEINRPWSSGSWLKHYSNITCPFTHTLPLTVHTYPQPLLYVYKFNSPKNKQTEGHMASLNQTLGADHVRQQAVWCPPAFLQPVSAITVTANTPLSVCSHHRSGVWVCTVRVAIYLFTWIQECHSHEEDHSYDLCSNSFTMHLHLFTPYSPRSKTSKNETLNQDNGLTFCLHFKVWGCRLGHCVLVKILMYIILTEWKHWYEVT